MPQTSKLSVRQMLREMKAGRKRPRTPVAHPRPASRADCQTGERPCPYVACRHHLFLDVGTNGTISFPFGDDVAVLEAMPHTCALDVAAQGEMSLEDMATLYRLSNQGMRLIYWQAMANLGTKDLTREVATHTEGCDNPEPREGPEPGNRRLRGDRRSGKHMQELLRGN